MVLAAFNLTLFEIIILQFGAVILGVTLYFFWVSNKSLSETIRKSKDQLNIPAKKKLWERAPLKTEALDDLQQQLAQIKSRAVAEPVKNTPYQFQPERNTNEQESLSSIKDVALRQQQTLNTLLGKIEDLEVKAVDHRELADENEDLKERLEKLELQLETKDSEIKKLKQQEGVAQQMAKRIEEVYKEFDVLQQKIQSLEKSTKQANSLALELEDIKQSYDQLQRELLRKQEKLDEAISENQRLYASLSVTEDKLAEANLQRQQLQKKVLFLQDINTDMQHMSESNTKLQNELRRIGELESMLSMISEERDRLANKGH
jgi:chromosome segregation ATPase